MKNSLGAISRGLQRLPNIWHFLLCTISLNMDSWNTEGNLRIVKWFWDMRGELNLDEALFPACYTDSSFMKASIISQKSQSTARGTLYWSEYMGLWKFITRDAKFALQQGLHSTTNHSYNQRFCMHPRRRLRLISLTLEANITCFLTDYFF